MAAREGCPSERSWTVVFTMTTSRPHSGFVVERPKRELRIPSGCDVSRTYPGATLAFGSLRTMANCFTDLAVLSERLLTTDN